MGLVSDLADIGVNAMLRCHSDSSAAPAFASRRGLGMLRHVHTRCFWLQSQVAQKSLQLRCAHGPQNLAGALTKCLAEGELLRLCAKMVGIPVKEKPMVDGARVIPHRLIGVCKRATPQQYVRDSFIGRDTVTAFLDGLGQVSPDAAFMEDMQTWLYLDA